MKIRYLFGAAALILLFGCGNSSTDGELTGQVKKVTHVTPLICPNYYAVDISLGVMRNGTGSMSTQDMWLTIRDDRDMSFLRNVAENGQLVKVHYDTKRMAICTEDHILTSVALTQ